MTVVALALAHYNHQADVVKRVREGSRSTITNSAIGQFAWENNITPRVPNGLEDEESGFVWNPRTHL